MSCESPVISYASRNRPRAQYLQVAFTSKPDRDEDDFVIVITQTSLPLFPPSTTTTARKNPVQQAKTTQLLVCLCPPSLSLSPRLNLAHLSPASERYRAPMMSNAGDVRHILGEHGRTRSGSGSAPALVVEDEMTVSAVEGSEAGNNYARYPAQPYSLLFLRCWWEFYSQSWH
jgi:hypothetical protein